MVIAMATKATLSSVALLVTLFASSVAQAGSAWLPVGGGIQVTSIESVRERAFSRTVRQQYDFSCGSAAVATLLTYQYDDPVSERDVFDDMWEHGDHAKIQHDGFSLLDIKRYLDARGYVANGYDVSLEKLIENGVPAIMLISDHGYNHFVVVKGLSKERVLLGDPSAGARIMSREQFKERLVTPIIFVITNQRERAVFNGRVDWKMDPMAPFGTAMDAARLAQQTVFYSRKPGMF